MSWRTSYLLAEKFEVLRAELDHAKRGADFEAFLGELFGREHFRVQRDFDADGRQIDVFAIRDRIHLLIEAKWTKRRAQHDVIDEMRARLATAAPDVIGLVVSMSGFSKNVVERVERSTDRPILLMEGAEVEEVVRCGGGLHSLIELKRDELVRNRKVFLFDSKPTVGRQNVALPEATLKIVDLAGKEHPWWESRGEFAEVVNPLSRPDTLWSGKGSVRLEMRIGCRTADDVVVVLRKLAQLGWISGEGTWRIEQRGIVWSGLGPAELARQLTDAKARYAGRRMHHSEKAMYVDESDDGMLVLAADISASPERLVRSCDLAFMLEGIPLDQSPYHALLAELPILNTPTFRIVIDDQVTFSRLGTPKRPQRADVRALLVREPSKVAPSGPESKSWVAGVIARAPKAKATIAARIAAGLPGLRLGDVLVHLGQEHLVEDHVVHELRWAHLIQQYPASVLYLAGDWGSDPPSGGVWS